MDELRDQIAAALRAHDYWYGCADQRCVLAPDCEGCLHRSNEMADAVIAALGLTEEPGHTFYGVNGPCEGVTPGPDPLGFQTPHYHRYVTPWRES